MLFNSLEFALYLPVVFALYWLVNAFNLKMQNVLVVAASYVFYGWWDYRFLSLLFFSTLVDYTLGRLIFREQREGRRKLLLYTSLAVNLGLLGYFKYYNFFLESFVDAFTFFGRPIEAKRLNIILPVGISFYTFQTLSYTLDIYKKRLKPSDDFIAFAAFVSFFPQLVAGPIERASNLLPQFLKKRAFDEQKAIDGMRQILWGLFKKVVIADNTAAIANAVFNHSDQMNGSALFLGNLFFTVQIYADFSGYSDIAIGTARLFGFNLSRNFSFPYFARSLPETWTKWHISLTNWFRDYLYIPLAFKAKKNTTKLAFLMVLQFLVIGFWHGADWTFVVWGLYQAIFMLPPTINRKFKSKYRGPVAEGRLVPNWHEGLQIIKTFAIASTSMIFFRSQSFAQVFDIFKKLLSPSLLSRPSFELDTAFITTSLFTVLFFSLEWIARESVYVLDHFAVKLNRVGRLALYYTMIAMILLFAGQEQDYIYFQF